MLASLVDSGRPDEVVTLNVAGALVQVDENLAGDVVRNATFDLAMDQIRVP